MIKKIYNILCGWYRRIFKPITKKEQSRLNICLKCGDKIKLGPEFICKHCGCPIKSKVRVEDEKCLMNKWYE